MLHLEAALAAGRTLGFALLLMFTLSLAPYIPQLVSGALVPRELARIWCILNLGLMFEILRNIIIFAYCMLLMVGNLRYLVSCVFGWLYPLGFIFLTEAASVKGASGKLRWGMLKFWI